MKIKKLLLGILGVVLLILGAIGIVLPILPTTPFVLAAAGCFSVASQKLNAWLTKSRLFGPFIENYRTGRGISNARKIASIAFLWTGLIISAIITQSLLILIILAIVGIGVSTHLLLIKKTEISD